MKRHLKPQALRQARKRSRQLTKCLLDRPRGGFVVIMGISDKKPHDHQARNQITTC